MSFRVRNLMADVGPGLFALVVCPNSGGDPGECRPQHSHGGDHDDHDDEDGTGCTNSGQPTTGPGDDEHGDQGHGGGQGGHRQALPLLRQQLRDALGAGA
jgi:hypothetical protein